jgi:hypothetical protein
MQALADFAASEAGKFYASVCERYNLDPAAPFDDDVEAFNARVAFAMNAPQPQEEPVADAKVVTDLDAQIEAIRRG